MAAKILHLLRELNIGGIERSTINYSNELVEQGLWIGIFCREGKFNHSNLVNNDVRLFYSNNPVSKTITWYVKTYHEIKKILEEENITIIHFHFRIYLPIIFLLKFFHKNISIIYTHHNVFRDIINHFIIADYVVSLNSHTTDDLPSRLKNKVTEIPHGVYIQKNNKLNGNKRIKNLGFVGRFDSSKGIPTLLNAFKNLLEIYPELNLVLRGEGAYLTDIKKIFYDLRIESNVILEPPKLFLDDIYNNIDLLIVPSIKLEGFGLVIIEAMSFGIPVITSDLEVFKGIVIPNETGLIFDYNSNASLYECLNNMIKNSQYREYLRISSKEYVTKNFHINDTVRAYFELYHSFSA